MKTRKNIYFKVVALAVIAIAFAMPAKAQLSDNGYANIDWQFNAPLSLLSLSPCRPRHSYQTMDMLI